MGRVQWLVLLIAVVVAPLGIAQDKKDAQQSDPFAPAQPLADGWEKMDERLIFLMVRLVDVEANLEAVDLAIAKSGARAGVARSTANRAEAGSDRMDRRAGGPVRWDQFYGRTAEKFFYHPTQNHTYHTETILSQQSPSNDNQTAPGVPSRQGLPVHQRPPQFDYMYRANENAKERATAEVAKIANKVDALAARRAELELDQSKLWCEVAFRVVSRNDLDKKPLYRFMPKSSEQESLTAAASFVVVALSIVKSGESDQSSAFRQIKPLVSKARSELGDKWLQLGVNYQDQSSNEWKFATLARHLEDVSSNLSDSYSVSIESARNSDNDRRDIYRGLLQKSLVQYAEAVLALNEMASELANANKFEPDLQKELHATNTSFSLRNSEPLNSSNGAYGENLVGSTLFRGHSYKVFLEAGLDWATAKTRCEAMGGHLVTITDEQENKFITALATKTISDINNSGIWLGATDERNEGQWKWLDGTQFKYTTWFDGQPNGKEKENYLLLLLSFRNAQGNEIHGWGDQPMSGKIHVIYYACEWDSAAVTTIPSQGSPADDAFDPFKQKSVWSDEGLKLTVIDRQGETFRGKLECNEWARIVRGTINDGQVSWLAKDVQIIKGFTGGDNHGNISSDDNGYKLDVEWKQSNGKSGSFTLRLNR